MVRSIFVALLGLGSLAPAANAQGKPQILNQRVCYGPLGATRPNSRYLPGDYLYMTFAIDGLTIDGAGKATYDTIAQVLDKEKKAVYEKKTTATAQAMLGGTRFPGDVQVAMGTKQPAGKYWLRLTIVDRPSKNRQSLDVEFEVLPAEFGIVGARAPGVGVCGQSYLAEFALVNMKLNAKNEPDIEVVMRVLDETGAREIGKYVTDLPRDLPAAGNLPREKFVPMQFPIFLNQPGRFVVDIVATDRAGKRSSSLRYQLNVLDMQKLLGQ